jgi:teichuronic acid biosynthesis glycosyltransferase TuaC
VLAVSQSLKGVAAGLGIPAEHIRVIPNGVDADVFVPRDPADARRALGLPDKATILLSVGGLNEGKGHHRVVAALPELVRRHPDLLYVVVGVDRPSDSSRHLIEREMARHGLEGRVFLAGERPHGEIPLWLAAANVFCLATRSEGWANVLLESLACGVPVVSTRVGGNPEIITHPGLGTLVPANDDAALVSALRDALQRDGDRPALLAHARAHSWDSAVSAVLEEFRAMTGAGGTSGLPLAGLHREPERPR